MSVWNDAQLRRLFLDNTPLIDVRAPIEFQTGSIPHSINLPIMNDEERHLVGTCYKENGQEAAISLGQSLVSGIVKDERVAKWMKAIQERPETEIFCFRGGLRSQIACQWLSQQGLRKSPIVGGYKRLRQFFLSYLDDGPLPQFIRLGGVTGSGKTRFLAQIKRSIDLEKLAHHRGSAFGGQGLQPTQISFENDLSLAAMKAEDHQVLVEDESQMIGKRTIPKRYFSHLRDSPLIILKVSEAAQIENLFNDYVVEGNREFFLAGVERIKTRISHEVYTQLNFQIRHSFEKGFSLSDHQEWISILVKHYYNPLYLKDIKRQSEKVVFEGSASEILAYLAVKL